MEGGVASGVNGVGAATEGEEEAGGGGVLQGGKGLLFSYLGTVVGGRRVVEIGPARGGQTTVQTQRKFIEAFLLFALMKKRNSHSARNKNRLFSTTCGGDLQKIFKD